MKPCSALLPCLTLLLTLGLALPANAESSKATDETKHGDEAKPGEDSKKDEKKIEMPLIRMPKADISASSADNPKEVGNQVREALGTRVPSHKKLTVVVSGKGGPAYTEPTNASVSPQYRQARAAALGLRVPAAKTDEHPQQPHDMHWTYEGDDGPQNWARMSPEFNLCSIGKRQSPINIQDDNTLLGPAESLQFNYHPSDASVVNNGHTILVEVNGENTLTVRGSTYRLVQMHFHAPSENEINFKRTAMVAHLVHKNDEGQFAVVAVQLDVGDANTLIDKVWTYMPLDTGDRVRMPAGSLNTNEIMPADQRYYQFMGSLTTPPCSENVLWMVIKQPLTVSRAQFKLFTQLYPMNARPVQPVNGRVVRQAQ